MAKGFVIIVTKDRAQFIEPTMSGDVSYSWILKRAGIEEYRTPLRRHFVRVQFANWTEDSFLWDEDETLPIWANDEMEERCKKLLLRVAPIWNEFNKIRVQASDEFNKIYAPLLPEYKEGRALASAEYEKVYASALADMVKAFSAIPGYVPELEVHAG